jgi:flagellar basal body P-ring formation protein FlgA
MPWTTFASARAVLARAGALLAAFGPITGTGPASATERRPVPALTIYPGDVIRDNMLADGEFPDSIATVPYALNRAMLVGKVARRTLLPNQPIPATAVGDPKLVLIGARVRLVYQDDGLVISTYASALQAGSAGDFVSVRNLESGVTLGGTIAPDGSVHVGGG